MRAGWWRVILCGVAGDLLFTGASAQEPPCSRLSVAGLRPGMTVADVRSVLRTEATVREVRLPDGRRASVEEYGLPEGVLHVEYDGLTSRGKSARVVLVRRPLRQTEDSVAALLERAGEPIAGRDALVRGLESDPVVWIDPMCDMVLTYRRRTEAWFTEAISSYLFVESLTHLPTESAASRIVRGYDANGAPRTVPAAEWAEQVPIDHAVANGAPVKPPAAAPAEHAVVDEVVASPAPVTRGPVAAAPATRVVATLILPSNAPPQQTESVAPIYPPRAKQQGVRGVVSLRVFVQKNGKVALARVTDVEPAGYGFAEAAVAAVERWKFRPARSNGRPVEGQIDLVLEFP